VRFTLQKNLKLLKEWFGTKNTCRMVVRHGRIIWETRQEPCGYKGSRCGRRWESRNKTWRPREWRICKVNVGRKVKTRVKTSRGKEFNNATLGSYWNVISRCSSFFVAKVWWQGLYDLKKCQIRRARSRRQANLTVNRYPFNLNETHLLFF
jgi:hypothetical protein